MTTSNYSVNFEAVLSATAVPLSIGDILVPVSTSDPTYTLATTAARGTRRTHGMGRMVGNPSNTISIQSSGYVPASVTGLGVGAETYGRVSATGRLERVVTVSASDDIVAWVDGSGGALLAFGGGMGSTVTPETDYTTQADWYIDAITGVDTNSGASGSPLKTHAELERRIGRKTINPPVDPSSTFNVMTVHVLTDLPEDDPINITYDLGQAVVVSYVGTVTATVQSGTLTTATAASGNAAWAIADGSVFGASYIGKRLRITGGARANTVAWFGKHNGSNVMRISDPLLPENMNSANDPYTLAYFYNTPTTPQIGDPYSVETLPLVTMGNINCGTANSTSSDAFAVPSISFLGFEFRSSVANSETLSTKASFIFTACKFNNIPFVSAIESYMLNNHYHHGIVCPPEGLDIQLLGGLVGFSGAGATCAGVRTFAGTQVVIGDNLMCQDVGMVFGGSDICIVSARVFDAAVTGLNPGGHGVVVGSRYGKTASGANLMLADVPGFTAGTLSGSGNAGYGLYVSPGSEVVRSSSAAPTITGSSGDLTLAGDSKGRASGEQVGMPSTRITTSWANLATAYASGGLGKSAHNFEANAHYLDTTAAVGPNGGATYTTIVGQALKMLRINAGETGTELVAPTYSIIGGTGTETFIPQQIDSSIDTKGTHRFRQPGHVQTTDATVTTLFSYTAANNATTVLSVLVVGTKTSAAQGAAYIRTAAFRNAAGTVAQIGSTLTPVTLEDDSAWDCTIDNSTTTIRVRVTGKAATTIQWSCIVQRLEVID